MNKEVCGIKYKQVPFEIMLKCDGDIICESWLLHNSLNKYGEDLTQPMLFDHFLKAIGEHLTSMNCKSIFTSGKWYVIDDGVQPDFFINKKEEE